MSADHDPSRDEVSPEFPQRAETGIEGLDAVLQGGLPRNHAYLVQGRHGSGKTTLALQFLQAGAARGERALYLTTCESEEEVREVARSHGWELDGDVVLHYHNPQEFLGPEADQSIFQPAEVELPQTMVALREMIDQVDPQRLVIDSLGEIRLLAPDGRRFRRQVLDLKENLRSRRCTTLICDDHRTEDQPVYSIVHGVIDLEQLAPDYGSDRRRLRVAKLRGATYTSGFHDFRIVTGGLQVYPRLVAAEHREVSEAGTLSSGVEELDTLFGGGIDRGGAALFLGPSGTGKSVLATRFAVTTAEKGARVAMYVFDERVQTLQKRAKGLGMDLESQVERGRVDVRQVDPAELSPGEFSHIVRRAVTEEEVELVVIDSLAGYLNAMPSERFLSLHLHELLAYLNELGVTVLMVMNQHGLPGTPRQTPFDVSYIADSVLLFHTFEFAGALHRAISVYKRREGPHEDTLRELRFGPDGVTVGRPLKDFQGIVTGSPVYLGQQLPHGEDEEE